MATREQAMATREQEKPDETQAEKAAASLPAMIVGAATVAGIVLSILALGGLAVGAVVTIAVISAPLLLFLSPILVPASTFIVVATVGLLGTGAAALVALLVFSWIYGYIKGQPVVGSKQIEAVQRSLAESVEAVKERAGEVVGTAKEKTGEAKEKTQEKASSQKTSSYQETSGSRGKAPT